MGYCRPSGNIYPYESVWSILQKFIHANKCTLSEASQAFKRISGSRALLTRRIFDDKSVAFATGVPTEMVSFGYCDSNLYQGIPYGSTLRFCGKCLDEGYHSPIHQLLYLERCPCHGTLIRDSCIQCNRRIDIGIITNPFECSFCKTRLYHADSAFKFSMNKSVSEAYERLGRILVKRAKCNPVIVPLKNDPGYLPESVWSMWEDAYGEDSQNCSREQITVKNVYSNNDDLCYERAYRVVRSRLRRDVLKTHGNCLKDLLTAPWVNTQYQIGRSDRYCPYAQAYIDWEIGFGLGEFGRVIASRSMSTDYSDFSKKVIALQLEFEFYNNMKNIVDGASWGHEYRHELKMTKTNWILCEAIRDKQAKCWRLVFPKMDMFEDVMKAVCERGKDYLQLDQALYNMALRRWTAALRE